MLAHFNHTAVSDQRAPFFAWFLVFVILVASTGILPHFLDYLEKDKIVLTENVDCNTEAKKKDSKQNSIGDDYLGEWSRMMIGRPLATPGFGMDRHQCWYHSYCIITTPPPEWSQA